MKCDVRQGAHYLQQGLVIAYPTESVYGLGCDPFNHEAVQQLLDLKLRPVQQGLILIAADWSQLHDYIPPLPEHINEKLYLQRDHPTTWLLPKNDNVPAWVSGEHDSIAVRVTQHPIAAELCRMFEGPIISTSANIKAQPPAMNEMDLSNYFPKGLAGIVAGELGGVDRPSIIIDAISDTVVRS